VGESEIAMPAVGWCGRRHQSRCPSQERVEPTPWCYRRWLERLGPSLQRTGTRESWWGPPKAGDEAGPGHQGHAIRRHVVGRRWRCTVGGRS
jgi:hypothetical protein